MLHYVLLCIQINVMLMHRFSAKDLISSSNISISKMLKGIIVLQ